VSQLLPLHCVVVHIGSIEKIFAWLSVGLLVVRVLGQAVLLLLLVASLGITLQMALLHVFSKILIVLLLLLVVVAEALLHALQTLEVSFAMNR